MEAPRLLVASSFGGTAARRPLRVAAALWTTGELLLCAASTDTRPDVSVLVGGEIIGGCPWLRFDARVIPKSCPNPRKFRILAQSDAEFSRSWELLRTPGSPFRCVVGQRIARGSMQLS
eukprot:scaffold4972_cov260-Pinguiococcus_pyrenoidosus.AAC.1